MISNWFIKGTLILMILINRLEGGMKKSLVFMSLVALALIGCSSEPSINLNNLAQQRAELIRQELPYLAQQGMVIKDVYAKGPRVVMTFADMRLERERNEFVNSFCQVPGIAKLLDVGLQYEFKNLDGTSRILTEDDC